MSYSDEWPEYGLNNTFWWQVILLVLLVLLLISVELYWHIWLRNIAHSSLDSGVNTLSAAHSDHNFLFQLHSATMQDAAPLQTNRSPLDNRGTIYSAGNQNISLHPYHILLRHFSYRKITCHVLRTAPHCILQIPVGHPRHSSLRKQWMWRRKQRLLITVL